MTESYGKYLSLFEEDKLFDKKSLVWDNGVLELVDDKYDQKGVPEGRMGEFKIERVLTESGVVLFFPIVKKTEGFFLSGSEVDSAKYYQVAFDQRFLKIEMMTKAEHCSMVEELKHSGMMVECFNDKNSDCITEFEGFYCTEDYGDMIGKVSSVLSEKEDMVYTLVYAGKGNYTDIKMEGAFILNRIIKQKI